ncbi:MAG: branched-chain amino acid ABC transporter permease [cyanobacterium endosymbiont of Rhopalodia musculus]|uniref:branched-chain amino acid ABC transporter permease n=1 Tax=cyanobacterium endosymbiont of Epithemia clementina EcSB TaxID=3034674 RepID=UPI0024802BC3|nr:branched-chain amino acid ABC transporter permease [cyanobacterium endosymbiont of Epithemia clementina EcSB]WGT67313.1 branched-chain amino acid ABC transporter permease [cyanobacterium endosymbiont of Epithemia clementina EcSB]
MDQLFPISDYIVFLTTSSALYGIFALGLNLQWGVTGLTNFGVVAFMTLGAYTTALLTIKGFPIIFAVLVGAIFSAILGLGIGLSTLRLGEDYLAIVTIGVSELIRLIVNNEEWLTGGTFGVKNYPLPLDFEANLFTKFILLIVLTLLAIYAELLLWNSLSQQWRQYQRIQGKSVKQRKPLNLIIWGVITTSFIILVYVPGTVAIYNYTYKAGLMVLALLTLAIIYTGLELLVHSPWGRILKAIREDENIATALGKNILFYKLQSFMLGGAISGIAGSFFAWQLTTIYPKSSEPLLTFNAWIIVVLGGAGSNAGVILGAIIFWAYDSITRFILPQLGMLSQSQAGAFRVMVIGLILMILMVWRPQGILGKKEELTLGK